MVESFDRLFAYVQSILMCSSMWSGKKVAIESSGIGLNLTRVRDRSDVRLFPKQDSCEIFERLSSSSSSIFDMSKTLMLLL